MQSLRSGRSPCQHNKVCSKHCQAAGVAAECCVLQHAHLLDILALGLNTGLEEVCGSACTHSQAGSDRPHAEMAQRQQPAWSQPSPNTVTATHSTAWAEAKLCRRGKGRGS